MRGFVRDLRAEFLKMRRTFLYPMHLIVPVVGSSVFLLYYSYAACYSEAAQVAGYVEIIGSVFPLLASIICAGNIGLEESGHFQTFLGNHTCKGRAFFTKWLALLLSGMLAVVLAMVLFAAGYSFLPGKEGLSAGVYSILTVLICLGSAPVYLEHLFLNLQFGRAVSMGVGAAQFLLTALFLTGLGDGRWYFFPSTWSARWSMTVLTCLARDEYAGRLAAEMKYAGVLCLLILTALCAMIGIWFHFYEGRRLDD